MDSAQTQSNSEDGGKICPNNPENVTPAMNNDHLQAPTQGQESKGTDNLASVMKFQRVFEIWHDIDRKPVFYCTYIIFTKGDEFFCTKFKYQYDIDNEIPIEDIPLEELNVDKPIPVDHMWPLFPQGLTIAPDPLPTNSYIRPSCLLYYAKGNLTESCPSGFLLAEARVCEILLKNPHPNIVEYLGCVVHANRIRGLGYVKYNATLETLVGKMPCKIDQAGRISLFNGIEAGIRHLLKLGIVHYDINPGNIMIDAENVPRIFDFDSCQKIDLPLGGGPGSLHWFNATAKFSEPENEYYGLTKIRDYLSLPSPSCSSPNPLENSKPGAKWQPIFDLCDDYFLSPKPWKELCLV